MKLVEIRDLVVRFGGNTVLRDVHLRIRAKEIVTIVGPNGSGKSTLLRVIIGALAPQSGQIEKREGLRIGYVPQRLHIDPTLPMTVQRFLGLPKKTGAAQANDALAQAGVPGLADRQMAALSGGQFQRVLLARALLDGPNLLILDEPTQGLDPSGAAGFYRQIEHVRHSFGCAVLMVSHDLHVVMRTSDQVVCLNGHVCCAGKPEQVASAPEYRAIFGGDSDDMFALYRHHGHTAETPSGPPEAIG